MALNAGDENVAAGTLAKAIYDNILAASDVGAYDSEADPAEVAETAQKAFAAAIAQAIVSHFIANAEVSITVAASTFGTGVPSSPVDISGGIE